jgi:acetoin utilization deacetylase AcuC-like enzyme
MEANTKTKKTGLIFFPAFDWAISPTHPEREERLLYTQDQVKEEGLLDLDNIIEYKAGIATEDDVKRTHICVPDVKSNLTESHLISAGGCIKAADVVLTGLVDNAFALVRPPGHHAMKVVHGNRGFCNVNIEAIMIEHIRKNYPGIKKIAVIDTDCHHGDGTQDIFWNDPNVLFLSIHQDGRTLYPGTGFIPDFGGVNAAGYNINVPLPPQTTDEGFLQVMEECVLPILAGFKPDLIINSAGQDNHYSDPITNMSFSANGYARLNEMLKPDIAVLEGGYSIESALPYVNVGIILAMAGLDYSNIREPDYNPNKLKQDKDTRNYISKVCSDVINLWNKREELQNEVHNKMKGKDYFERSRRIYYDTDGISENQRERVRVCKKCGGLWTIDTDSSRGYSAYAIILQKNTCSDCRDAGENEWKNAKKQNQDYIYFQDVDKDLFLVK